MHSSIILIWLCQCAPCLTHASLGRAHPSPYPQTTSRLVQPSLHHPQHSPYTLQWANPSPSKLPIHIGWSGLPSNTRFLRTTGVHIPNGILIGSAVFAGLTIITDRQTDRPTDHATPSVTIGRSYLVLRCGLKSLNSEDTETENHLETPRNSVLIPTITTFTGTVLQSIKVSKGEGAFE